MAFARKRLLRAILLLAELVAPAIEHPFRHPQVAGDLRHRLLTALAQAHGFQLELAAIDPLLVPLVRLPLLLCGHTSRPFQFRGVYALTVL